MVLAFRNPDSHDGSGAWRMDEGNRVDWRELCAAAATEPDSEKLADLVDQIIRALDERAGLESPAQFVQP